jgi:hypothetical protein
MSDAPSFSGRFLKIGVERGYSALSRDLRHGKQDPDNLRKVTEKGPDDYHRSERSRPDDLFFSWFERVDQQRLSAVRRSDPYALF